MTNITTYTAGIIAALGIAGAALACAGTAVASTDPGQPNITPSPSFAPQHITPATGFGGDISHGYLGSPGRHHHGGR